MRVCLLHIALIIAPTQLFAQTPSSVTNATDVRVTASRAQSAKDLEIRRGRSGIWFGPQFTRASLIVRSEQAQSETQIDASPALALGVELWPSDDIGVFLSGAVGLGLEIDAGELRALFDQDDNARTVIDYNLHQLEAGARYRWFLGPEIDALSIIVGAGLNGRFQSARDQFPAILLDRMLLGPMGSVMATLPFADARAWIRFSGRAGMPFFVRETPADSGDPQSFSEFGGRLEIAYLVFGRWSAQLQVDYAQRTVVFEDEATRGFGTFDVTTDDTFISGGLFVRYAPALD